MDMDNERHTDLEIETMKTTYINGDEVVYTGNTRILRGKTFYEVEFIEGHHTGEIAGTYRAPGTVGPADLR